MNIIIGLIIEGIGGVGAIIFLILGFMNWSIKYFLLSFILTIVLLMGYMITTY